MPRKTRSPLESRASRLALAVDKKPRNSVPVAKSIRLFYRRNQGPGTWIVKAFDGKGVPWTKGFAAADDFAEANGTDILDYWQAREKALAIVRGDSGDVCRPATWGEALDTYAADLRDRHGDPRNASGVRYHLTDALAAKPVALLTAIELRHWRARLLASGLKPSSVQRLRRSAVASLNLAAKLDPRIKNREAWAVGLASLGDDYEPVSRVLSDLEVKRIVAEGYGLDSNAGLYYEALAGTGARPSQLCRLTVADLQDGPMPRLQMPGSRKGRGRKEITRKPVPITIGLSRKLKMAAGDRPGDAPLLTRADGRPWKPNRRPLPALFREMVRRAGLEGITPYAFRHSSITRALLNGVPARVTAAAHDTSIKMLEKTYSAFILDHADAVARKGLLDTEEPVVDNKVVSISGRR
jgi:integrase